MSKRPLAKGLKPYFSLTSGWLSPAIKYLLLHVTPLPKRSRKTGTKDYLNCVRTKDIQFCLGETGKPFLLKNTC
jgi:hypothetical protein